MAMLHRSFRIVFFTVIAFVALDEDARIMASGVFHDGYSLLAGRSTPTPLERPALLARAGLDDCLRGIARADTGEPYADFCTDLATFAETLVASSDSLTGDDLAATSEAVPKPKARVRRVASAGTKTEASKIAARAPEAAPVRPLCLVDETGAASTQVDGIWMKQAPEFLRGPERDARSRKVTQIVAVPDGCAVQSPVNAKVLYAGSFKGYLGIVILETKKMERLTIAGLEDVAVTRGETVSRGAKIGTTTARAAPALAGATGTHAASLLYVADSTATVPAS